MEDKSKSANMGVSIFLFFLTVSLLVFTWFNSQKSKEELTEEISNKVTEDVRDAIKEEMSKLSETEISDSP